MRSCLGCSQICIVMYQPVVCKLPINITRSNKKNGVYLYVSCALSSEAIKVVSKTGRATHLLLWNSECCQISLPSLMIPCSDDTSTSWQLLSTWADEAAKPPKSLEVRDIPCPCGSCSATDGTRREVISERSFLFIPNINKPTSIVLYIFSQKNKEFLLGHPMVEKKQIQQTQNNQENLFFFFFCNDSTETTNEAASIYWRQTNRAIKNTRAAFDLYDRQQHWLA